jgi:hypothetical protein
MYTHVYTYVSECVCVVVNSTALLTPAIGRVYVCVCVNLYMCVCVVWANGVCVVWINGMSVFMCMCV